MKEVEVKFTGGASLFVVSIDGNKLQFAGDTASVNLAGGHEYTIQWFARGEPGAKYTIQVTKPKEAVFAHSATLDAAKKDAGVFWFKISPEQEGVDA
jgi:hypothetical protein